VISSLSCQTLRTTPARLAVRLWVHHVTVLGRAGAGRTATGTGGVCFAPSTLDKKVAAAGHVFKDIWDPQLLRLLLSLCVVSSGGDSDPCHFQVLGFAPSDFLIVMPLLPVPLVPLLADFFLCTSLPLSCCSPTTDGHLEPLLCMHAMRV
jgi:hypothetical protein